MKPLIILKLGGSVITDKSSTRPKIRKEIMQRLAKEIYKSYSSEEFSLLLIHGAGSFGHPIVKRTGIDKGIKNKNQLEAFAETQRLQNVLNSIVTKFLIKEGLPSIPCQASSFVVTKSGEINEMSLSAVNGLLSIGLIPVLYGVPVYDLKQKCSILSGDQLATYLAKNLNATRIIHATDVDGIFTSDPKTDKNAKLIKEINQKNVDNVRELLTGSKNIDVTGGMFGKVSELLEVGVESQIINGLKDGYISRALDGEKIGTIIRL